MQATIAEHEQAPERRVGQRALAHELTELVHGPEAAQAADEAADVLFGGDPTGTSEAALAAVAREVPSSQVASGDLGDVVELLVRVGLGSSKGDVRRTLEGGGYRSNGVVLTADTRLPEQKLLHGRYLLLQRGRKSHHLVEVFPDHGLSPPSPSSSVAVRPTDGFRASGRAKHQARWSQRGSARASAP